MYHAVDCGDVGETQEAHRGNKREGGRYLVRGYAWKTILGSNGVLNGFLQYTHITHAPVSFLLYSPFAVILMLTHIYTPFVFLPIYASLESIPRPLVEASQDLGATPAKTFLRVILPLSMPGLVAGATFAFVLSLRSHIVHSHNTVIASRIPLLQFSSSHLRPRATIRIIMLISSETWLEL